MSITHEVTIWCDGEGCGQWYRDSGTATTIRKRLYQAGWSEAHVPNGTVEDYCVACTKKHNNTIARLVDKLEPQK